MSSCIVFGLLLLASACANSDTGTGDEVLASEAEPNSSSVTESSLQQPTRYGSGTDETKLFVATTVSDGTNQSTSAVESSVESSTTGSVKGTSMASTSAQAATTATAPVSTGAVAVPATGDTTTSPTSSEAPVVPAALAPRSVPDQSYSPMAVFAEVQVLHPSARVERVGFHQSNHDGARQFEILPTAVSPLPLESRNRGTGSRTAADVVVDPSSEIRAPVTGTVLRAGGYVLYCKHSDDFVVIEPDSHPGWELKVLHITGVQVTKGQRVEAGVTVLAPGPTQLPFDSQVDEFTAEPSWPHVHIELVDPSIPDRPSTGGGC